MTPLKHIVDAYGSLGGLTTASTRVSPSLIKGIQVAYRGRFLEFRLVTIPHLSVCILCCCISLTVIVNSDNRNNNAIIGWLVLISFIDHLDKNFFCILQSLEHWRILTLQITWQRQLLYLVLLVYECYHSIPATQYQLWLILEHYLYYLVTKSEEDSFFSSPPLLEEA